MGLVLEPRDINTIQDNEDLVHMDHTKVSFYAHFEFFGRYANMRLIIRSLLDSRFFNGIKYDDAIKLKNWLEFTRDEKLFNFGICEMRSGKEVIAKTCKGKNFVLKLTSVSFVGFENLPILKIEERKTIGEKIINLENKRKEK